LLQYIFDIKLVGNYKLRLALLPVLLSGLPLVGLLLSGMILRGLLLY
jgi:hypothetical protein